MTIWCGGMLRSIRRNAHAIAAAVTAIVIEGQWFSRRCLADIWSYVPLDCFRYFGGEEQGVKEIITCQTCCPSQQSRVRRDKAALSSGCKSHPAVLQPEAVGAAMEVTK